MPNYEDLAHKGAYSPKSVYTPEDVAHIVSYAGGVRFHIFRLFNTNIY